MATTPHLGLFKPAGGDLIKVQRDLNQNLDKIDTFASKTDLGWTYVDSGVANDVNSFIIDFTIGGKFPAGTFSMVRVFMAGTNDASIGSSVRMRVNSDDTTDLYKKSRLGFDYTDGISNVNTSVSSTLWEGSFFNDTDDGNTFEFTIFGTKENSKLSLLGTGVRILSGDTHYFIAGDLSEARLLDSLQIFLATGVNFINTVWFAEGFLEEVPV